MHACYHGDNAKNEGCIGGEKWDVSQSYHCEAQETKTWDCFLAYSVPLSPPGSCNLGNWRQHEKVRASGKPPPTSHFDSASASPRGIFWDSTWVSTEMPGCQLAGHIWLGSWSWGTSTRARPTLPTSQALCTLTDWEWDAIGRIQRSWNYRKCSKLNTF